jgi:hypothetical protein
MDAAQRSIFTSFLPRIEIVERVVSFQCFFQSEKGVVKLPYYTYAYKRPPRPPMTSWAYCSVPTPFSK